MKIKEFAETMVFAYKENPLEAFAMSLLGIGSVLLMLFGLGMIILATVQLFTLIFN